MWLPPDAVDHPLPDGSYPNKLSPTYGDPKSTPLKLLVTEGPNDVRPYELPGPKATRR